MRIKVVKRFLEVPINNDENVGGGRAKNVYHNQQDARLIREESDPELQYLLKQRQNIIDFLKTLSNETVQLMKWHYDSRDYHSWIQIALLTNKSESQCRRDLKEAKQQFEASVWNRIVDNFTP